MLLTDVWYSIYGKLHICSQTGICIAECGRKRDVNKYNIQEEDMNILLEEH